MKAGPSMVIASALLGVVAAGCGTPHRVAQAPTLKGQRIAVMELSTTEAVVRYNRPEGFGLALAEEIAGELRRRGYQAEAFPGSSQPTGDAIVRGRITRIDGGSRALRYFVSFGAGATDFAAEGNVSNRDGKVIGNFWDERRSGWGIFGGSSEALLQKCVRRVGREIGQMIDSGQYWQKP